jgi:hypothetical protein
VIRDFVAGVRRISISMIVGLPLMEKMPLKVTAFWKEMMYVWMGNLLEKRNLPFISLSISLKA